MAGRLPTDAGCHAGGVTPVRAVLLDFYCTLVDLSGPVRSRGFDDFARQLGLPLGPADLPACVRCPVGARERGGDGRRHS
jgi:hypothetical protein